MRLVKASGSLSECFAEDFCGSKLAGGWVGLSGPSSDWSSASFNFFNFGNFINFFNFFNFFNLFDLAVDPKTF